jgi:hypothetical protein
MMLPEIVFESKCTLPEVAVGKRTAQLIIACLHLRAVEQAMAESKNNPFAVGVTAEAIAKDYVAQALDAVGNAIPSTGHQVHTRNKCNLICRFLSTSYVRVSFLIGVK